MYLTPATRNPIDLEQNKLVGREKEDDKVNFTKRVEI